MNGLQRAAPLGVNERVWWSRERDYAHGMLKRMTTAWSMRRWAAGMRRCTTGRLGDRSIEGRAESGTQVVDG